MVFRNLKIRIQSYHLILMSGFSANLNLLDLPCYHHHYYLYAVQAAELLNSINFKEYYHAYFDQNSHHFN